MTTRRVRVLQIARTRNDLNKIKNSWNGASIAFVPTMGALHDGHLSLVTMALENADKAVVSIFVNPAQFAPNEDLAAYPRTEEADLEKLRTLGAHLAYLPGVAELYPDGVVSDRKAGPAAGGLESDFRPHFFDGVVSAVARLFDHVRPDISIFGEKDYQQLQVVKEAFPDMRILGAPTGRDAHGLALSSRNVYLSAEQLQIARRLNGILFAAAEKLRHCEEAARPTRQSIDRMDCFADARDDDILTEAKSQILAAGFDSIDYLSLRWNRLLAAVRLGNVRLIDNVWI